MAITCRKHGKFAHGHSRLRKPGLQGPYIFRGIVTEYGRVNNIDVSQPSPDMKFGDKEFCARI